MEGLKTGISEESPLNRRVGELTHAYRTFQLNTEEYTFPVLHGTFLKINYILRRSAIFKR